MNALKRTGNVFSKLINILFVLLICCIIIATVVLDKTVNNPYPNTVIFANAVYYMIAAVLLVKLWRVCYAERSPAKPGMSARTYYCALAAIALVVAVIQFFISKWMPYNMYSEGGDFGSISNGAWALANGEGLKYLDKFRTNPNNLNITFVITWLYTLVRRPRFVVWIGALLTNASMVLTSLAVYNVTRREKTALTIAIMGELLIALTWRAFLVYTDNYGMIFVALVLWLFTTKLRPTVKYPLIILCTALAAYIKMTNFILIAALFVWSVIRWMRSDDHRIIVKRLALYLVCLVVLFTGLFVGQKAIRTAYGFTPGKFPKNWQFMFLVGQNTKQLGTVGGNNGAVRDKLINKYGNNADVSRELLKRAFKSIRDRGLWGNIAFYEKKINIIYNDGYFHNVQRDDMYKMDKTFLYNVYIHDGAYYQVLATLFQIMWDAILLTMALYALVMVLRARARRRARRGKPTGAFAALFPEDLEGANGDTLLLTMILALAINAYLMCLEGRAKYLYMFTPIYIGMFGIMFHQLSTSIAAALRKCRVGMPASVDKD